MKSRSEVLKERSKKNENKSSAEERTRPLPNLGPNDKVTCEACDEESLVSKLEKRDDGTFECPHCAAPIEVKTKKKAAPKDEPEEEEDEDEEDASSGKKAEGSEDEEDDDEEDEEEEEKPKKRSEAKPKPKADARSMAYCGECGAEWPLLDGRPQINCGHMKAPRVDDPRKATKMKDITPSGVTKPPSNDVENKPMPKAAQPQITMSGNRMSIGWGKMSFPVGESRGFKFSNMEVPNQIITVDLPEGADRVKVAREILADLQKIADLAFELQFNWYKEKLGQIDE